MTSYSVCLFKMIPYIQKVATVCGNVVIFAYFVTSVGDQNVCCSSNFEREEARKFLFFSNYSNNKTFDFFGYWSLIVVTKRALN